MTANMSTALYDRLAAATGIPRYKVKTLLYRLAYDGETITAPPGPEELMLRPGIAFAQRTLATQELADWLEKYSYVVAKERPEFHGRAAFDIASELINGATGSDVPRKDSAALMNECAELREKLSEIQDLVDDALRIGGA